MKNKIQKVFHRNGQLHEEMPLKKGRPHGLRRSWHKNGVLASAEPYQDGVPHGVCRQWDESGRLLGKYKMVHGTGGQREWHDNGRLKMEVFTFRGEFIGYSRAFFNVVSNATRFKKGPHVVSALRTCLRLRRLVS